MEDRGEVLHEIKPKYDFFYEMTMPTGKKTKKAIVGVLLTLAITIILFVCKKYVANLNNELALTGYTILEWVFVGLTILSCLVVAARIVAQMMEYKGMKYSFYDNCMVIENNFLNQVRKTIEYSNIKEIEIRKNVTDRILNYGIIIIYTNADKVNGSATVIYSVKDIEEHYNKIESIIHHKNSGNTTNNVVNTATSIDPIQEEKNFQEKLTRVNNESEVTDADINAESESTDANVNTEN